MEESIWEEKLRKNASTKDLELYYRVKEGICTKKREGLLVVKRGKRRDTSICGRSAKKRVHSTL